MALLLAGCAATVVAVGASRNHSQSVRSALAKLAGKPAGSDVLAHSVRLAGDETHRGVTMFRLRVTGCGSDGAPQQWEVLRSYDDFAQLRSRLSVRRCRAGSRFPGKTWLLPCRGKWLAERRRLLHCWLQGVLAEFQTGGDAQHAFICRQRSQKLRILHEFLGFGRNGQLQQGARPVPLVAEPVSWSWDVKPLASQALYLGTPALDQSNSNAKEEAAMCQQAPHTEVPASQALYFGSPVLHVPP